MIRLRTLIATALLTIPVLALSAAAPTTGLGKSFDAVATSGSAPPGCFVYRGVVYCF